ncbi:hypothetical protein PENSPDRAFT_737573 [Peniophora sp. CONT]|nr:hypothetical protein PENSPDRAFT_737573 [Peniophora sp. CONT]
MLKIWQQSWSKKPVQKEPEKPLEQSSGQGRQLSDPVADAASHVLDAPSNDPETVAPTAFPPTLRHKRDSSSLGTTSLSRRTKKQRTKYDLAPGISAEAPEELVVFHERLDQLPLTPLYRKLHEADPEEQYLRRYFSASRHVLVEVGTCASELVWRRAANVIESSIVELDEDEEPDPEAPQTKERLAKLEILNVIKHWDFSMPNLDATSRGFNVTPKFLKLAQILKSCQPYGEDFRGIVFVRKKAVAQEMVDLIRTIEELDFLRPQLLVGRRMHGDPEAQIDLFQMFATGTCNFILATKRAEDLEIPPATVVIRYDIYDSHLSYGLARARTGGKHARLIHMIPRGSDIHRRRLTEITQLSQPVQDWLGTLLGGSSARIPPYDIRETNDPYISDSEDEDEPSNWILDPTTSGRIRLQDAMRIVYRFASMLPQEKRRLFTFQEADDDDDGHPQFTCTVRLQADVPVPPITSPPALTRSHARRIAAYMLCKELFDRGLLDYHLFPRPFDNAAPRRHTINDTGFLDPDDADAAPQLPPKGTNASATGTRCYTCKMPEFWKNSVRVATRRLHPTVICIRSGMGYAPMMLVTRQPLPPLADFDLFVDGMPLRVYLRRGAAFDVIEEQLHLFHSFTIRIVRAIQNKAFTVEMDKAPYFFAPLSLHSKWADRISADGVDSLDDDRWNPLTVVEDIAWASIRQMVESNFMELRVDSHESLQEDLVDAVVQDRWIEFTRRFYAVGLRADLTPLSKPEEGIREESYDTYLAYVAENRHNFEGIKRADQPLIQVSRVMPVQNLLSPANKTGTDPTQRLPTKYLVPEYCAKSTIPASVFRTSLLLPSITHKIDALMLVKELNARLFDNSILEDYLLSAICSPAAAFEHDYERLELLGDAYLKYLSTTYVFVISPAQHEGALHQARLRIISNRALLLNGDAAGLPPFIQSKQFISKLWTPPNFVLEPPPPLSKEKLEAMARAQREAEEIAAAEKGSEVKREPSPDRPLPPPAASASATTQTEFNSTEVTKANNTNNPPKKLGKRGRKRKAAEQRDVHWLGDKAVADVVESIIGAAYMTGGRETALKACKALCVGVPRIDRWQDFAKMALAPPPQVTSKLRAGTVEAIERILGAKFVRPHLLAQALTHASIQGYEMTCYERLEFLGDAILDFLVINHIYNKYTTMSPGALTMLKGSMVSNATLAAVCVEAGLHEYLMFESLTLANGMDAYAARIKQKQREEYAEAEREGRAPGQYWLDIEGPKPIGGLNPLAQIISDVVESIIGAIYISDNFGLEGCTKFYDRVLRPFYDKHISMQTLAHHPTKTLFELFQTYGCQRFEVVRRQELVELDGDVLVQGTVCEMVVHDTILARGADTTSANAAKRVCLLSLDALEGDPGFMSRTCDCRLQSQARKAQKKVVEKLMDDLDVPRPPGETEKEKQRVEAEAAKLAAKAAEAEQATTSEATGAKEGDVVKKSGKEAAAV